MNKDKIIVSVVIDKQALVDRAFDISKNPFEFNELKKANNTNLFAHIALDIIFGDHQELAITKRLNSLEDKKSSFLAKMKKLDELQKKVESGEMPGVKGLRELLKVMEEDE